MLAGRRNVAFRHVGHDGCHDRVAERRRDLAGQRLRPGIVLAQRHVRAALLGGAHRDDDGRGARLQRVAQLGPGEVLEIEAARRGLGAGSEAKGREDE